MSEIGAIAPWYGSKRTLAPRIVESLGPHAVYWEPFCGSMAVLLSKPAVTYESVNDLHRDLVNLALVLQNWETAQDLYERAYRTLFHEEMCGIAKARLTALAEASPPDVERAYWYLVYSWFHLNGLAGTKMNRTGKFCVRYSPNGGNGATRWRGVVESIPDWHERLLRVQITCKDGLEILERVHDKEGTALYVDPPYLAEGDRYVHSFKPEQHERLAELCRRFRRARVVVSYYEHPALAKLYPDWQKLTDLGMQRNMANAGSHRGNGRVEAPEVLLLNQPPEPKGLF